MTKKGEMGVGTLIIFIAMLLVAAVAAGVLIQTVSSLQEKSLSTGEQAEGQISTNAQVVEVSATDGRNGDVTDFYQRMKLSPGSDPIKLEEVIFTFNTKDATSTLKYRGEGSVCEKNNQDGYNTWTEENLDVVNNSVTELEEDLDDDSVDDTIYLDTATNDSAVYVNVSSYGVFEVDTGVNLSNPPNTLDVYETLENGTETYGYLNISGTQEENNTLNDLVTVTPYKEGEGYFAATYEQTGSNHVPGNLQRGDVIRLCYEAPTEITSEQELRLNFIPKTGTSTMTKFMTPNVISTQRVYLYP